MKVCLVNQDNYLASLHSIPGMRHDFIKTIVAIIRENSSIIQIMGGVCVHFHEVGLSCKISASNLLFRPTEHAKHVPYTNNTSSQNFIVKS